MTEILLEQTLYGNPGAGGYRFLARSPGFLDEWQPLVEQVCAGFGERPAGAVCPACVFARPFAAKHVAIVQAADQGTDDAGRPGALAFRVFVLTRNDYEFLGGNPFEIADRFPPSWTARGHMPSLTWPAEAPTLRTVAQVQRALQRPGGDVLHPGEGDGSEVRRGGSHVLLGGAQALVDGCKLVFERSAPDTDLLRDLWLLLPTATRCRLWPASYAFGNALGFDVLVVPRATGDEFRGYRTEVEAADYPEGHYEYNLQHAAEAGSQHELDALFGRRTATQTIRLVLVLLAGLALAGVIIPLLPRPPAVAPEPAPRANGQTVPPDLPPATSFRTLSSGERDRLTAALRDLAVALGAARPGASMEELLAAIDQRLGRPASGRDPAPLDRFGPIERRLRVLLWKHDIPDYRDLRLNTIELVERLQRKVLPRPEVVHD